MREDDAPQHSSPAQDSLSAKSEFEFIASVRRQAQNRPALSALLAGIGDDAAIVRETAGRNTLITTDLLIEDIDFHRDTTTARFLGHKALAVSLSDIAAMGGRPRWSLLSLGIPGDIWNSDFVDEFYAGFFALADRYDISLIGGDLSRSVDKLVIDSIVIGQCDEGQAIRRHRARPGDQIFVTGSLGGSAAGLRLLERGVRLHSKQPDFESAEADSQSVRAILMRHVRPEPRVGWGLVLGNEGLANSMIDISDGLSSDLRHLCEESGTGAIINAASLPIDPMLTEICGRRALDPLMLALHGGEDFELLFTVPAAKATQLPRKVDDIPITCIGEIKNLSEGVRLAEGTRTWELEAGGWQHFKN